MSFRSQSNEVCNEDFDLDELVGAVRLTHGSAAGPGGVCCLMLKRLLESSLEALWVCLIAFGLLVGFRGVGHMQR